MIDMENKNVTIALAYLNQGENPLNVFCNLISYSLIYAENKTLRQDQLKIDIKERFGLALPNHIIKACMRILKNKKHVRITENTTYVLDKTDFDTEAFNEECNKRKIREENLIANLIEYVMQFGKTWTMDEAKAKFTEFLLNDDNAYNLFVYNKISLKPIKNQVSDTWYISNYLRSLDEDNPYYLYLLEIVNGMMVFIGLCQFENYSQTYNEKFKDTNFFIDTRLLLRHLGYSWMAAVEETQELVHLITKEYGGRICIFEHTLNEAQNAIDNECYSLKYGKEENFELRVFRIQNSYNADRFELDSIALRRVIEEKNNITIIPSLDWTQNDTITNNINWNDLIQFLKAKNSSYNSVALNNDITSINNINVIRKGDYSIQIGGKKKLPIFVTTNYPLISNFKEYINKNENKDFNCINMPLIADSTLMYRLWLPKAAKARNVPAIKLARTLYAAQQEDSVFYEKLKHKLKLLEGNVIYNIDDIAEKYSRTLFELVAKKANGNYENFTDEIVSSSLEELLQITSAKKDDMINELNQKDANNNSIIHKQKNELVEAYSLRFINKIGIIDRVYILIGNYSWICIIVLLILLGVIFDQIEATKLVSNIAAPIGILLAVILKAIDKYISQKNITNSIKKWAFSKAKNVYKCRVKNKLTEKEKDYEEEILEKCIINTTAFNFE